VYGKCEYKNDKRAKDGETYEGYWQDGKPHGKGVRTFPVDGGERKYEGTFFDGKPIGKGKKIYEDGREEEGYWAGGKFFSGKPAEGLLEKQLEDLEEAQLRAKAIEKKLIDEEEEVPDTIFTTKKVQQLKKKENTDKEDIFSGQSHKVK